MPFTTRDFTELCAEVGQSCFMSRSQNKKSLAGRSEGQNVGERGMSFDQWRDSRTGPLIATVQMDK
jgi:hypothetical protein